MFDEVFLSQKIKRSPLFYPSGIISVLLHVMAVFVLLMHPEIAFPKRIFSAKRPSGQSAETKPMRVVTYLDQPKSFVIPTQKPQTDFYSDQDRLARSRPPQMAKKGNRLPYSRGKSKIPARTDALAQNQVTPPKENEPKAFEPSESKSSSQAPTPAKTAEALGPKNVPKEDPFIPLPPDSLNKPIVPEPPRAEKTIKSAESPSQESKSAPKAALQNVFENEQSALKQEGSGFFDTKGFYLGDYAHEIVRRIKQNWIIPGQIRYSRGRSTVIFYIEKDGRVSNLRIYSTSGSQMFDMTVLNSIYNSNPFPPLPKGFPGEHVGLKFIFSYNEN